MKGTLIESENNGIKYFYFGMSKKKASSVFKIKMNVSDEVFEEFYSCRKLYYDEELNCLRTKNWTEN